MKIKTLLFVGAIGIALATPESLQAQANPKPVRPDVGDVKDAAKGGGKERPKLDVAKIKERLKAAFAHGAHYDFGPSVPLLIASYHPSPRNTNTGRLSKENLVGVLLEVRRVLGLKSDQQ